MVAKKVAPQAKTVERARMPMTNGKDAKKPAHQVKTTVKKIVGGSGKPKADRQFNKSIAMSENKAWQARLDLRTLQEAKQIQADKSRVAAATKEAKSQVQAIQAVVGKK